MAYDEGYGDYDDGEDDGYDGESGNVLGPDGPRLVSEKCPTCIFRPGNPMHLRPGRVQQMVRDSLRADSFITCHSTLPGVQQQTQPAVCRGFYDAYGPQSGLLRVWGRIGRGFVEVPPSCLRPKVDAEPAGEGS